MSRSTRSARRPAAAALILAALAAALILLAASAGCGSARQVRTARALMALVLTILSWLMLDKSESPGFRAMGRRVNCFAS